MGQSVHTLLGYSLKKNKKKQNHKPKISLSCSNSSAYQLYDRLADEEQFSKLKLFVINDKRLLAQVSVVITFTGKESMASLFFFFLSYY